MKCKTVVHSWSNNERLKLIAEHARHLREAGCDSGHLGATSDGVKIFDGTLKIIEDLTTTWDSELEKEREKYLTLL